MTDENCRGWLHAQTVTRHYGEFNGYGYVLLAKKTKEAINVFRLNTMIYPDNANVFDSLAEALGKLVIKKKRLPYEKVLALKPGDEK
jgi:hypothetical protein